MVSYSKAKKNCLQQIAQANRRPLGRPSSQLAKHPHYTNYALAQLSVRRTPVRETDQPAKSRRIPDAIVNQVAYAGQLFFERALKVISSGHYASYVGPAVRHCRIV